jgi:hypothetical protein
MQEADETSGIDKASEVVETPDYECYADSFQLGASPYTFTLVFGLKRADGKTSPLTEVRMSPEHAKVMAILFKRAVKRFEEALGADISVSPHILREKNVDLSSDW